MTRLDGYTTLGVLATSEARILIRVRPLDGDGPVVVKLLTSDQPTPEDEARLRHECAIAAELPPEGIVRPLGVERFGHRLGLVLEDTDGVSLAAVIGPSGLEVGTCLRLGASLARTLAVLHHADVIHRDVKPANVIVDAGLTGARLSDFGIATRLPRVHTDAAAPALLEGTLAYMAPEQTGRTNRPVDHRADLYALGVTLYQMLTGRLPFTATDALELVHCHLAVRPPSPAELAGVPAPVSDIVMRLLAKNPEDRYQSASGLAHDLEVALVEFEVTGTVETIVLGTRDAPARFEMPARLYGRSAEIAALVAGVDEVAKEGSTLLLLSGPAGAGKTALVGELRAPVAARRGYLVSGKFDQFSRNIPYASVTQAFGALVRQVLGEPRQRVREWQDALAEALGTNAGVLADVIPHLRVLVGDVAAAPALGPAETQHRFNLAFSRFVGVFARAEHPLVVFLDDLHWADSASLKLIEAVLADPEQRHLLVVGAYRPAEVPASHPLAVLLSGMPGERVRRIEVGPLEAGDVTELVADALRAGRAETAALARLLHDRTDGNPFYVGQLLRSVAADRLLRFSDGRWVWDLGAITTRGLTNDVVEFMIGRLARLPGDCRGALQVAAVIGNEVDLGTLAAVLGQPAATVANALWPAIAAGLLLPLGEAHELVGAGLTEAQVSYRFLHDRVQQASHATIDPAGLPDLHRRVGSLLLDRLGDGDEGLFEVVEHLNTAVALTADGSRDLGLARLNLRAAARAGASTAYDAAADLLAIARRHLPSDAWTSHYELSLALHISLGEVLAVLGRLEESEAAYRSLEDAARNPADAALGQASRAEGLLGLGRVFEAEVAAKRGLALAGFALAPLEAGGPPAHMLTESAAHGLLEVGTANERDALMARLLRAGILAAQFSGSGEANVLIVNAVRHVATSGASRHCGIPVVYFGEMASRTGHQNAGVAYAEVAMEMATRHGDVLAPVVGALGGAFCTVWTRPVHEHIQAQRDAFLACEGQGMPVFANYPIHAAAWATGMSGGDQAEHLAAWDRAVDYGRRFVPLAVPTDELVADSVRRLVSPQAAPVDVGRVVDRMRQVNPLITGLALAFVSDIHALLGEHDAALRFAREARALFEAAGGVCPGPPVFHLCLGTAVAAARLAAAEQDAAVRDGLLAEAQEASDRLKPLLAGPPGIFAAYGPLMDGAVAHARGDQGAAVAGYLAAVDGAAAAGYPLLQGWANELLGRLHRERGRVLADVHLREARALYLRCHAQGKVALFDAEFPWVAPAAPREALEDTLTVHGSEAATLDLSSVLRASRAIAAETSPERVVERLESVAASVTGALTAVFLAPEDRSPTPEGALDLPILRNEALAGTLRLELDGRPPAEGLGILRLLAPQMAVSLENARLYAGLEAEVAARSSELSATLDELRVMQDQIVQSEKLAALGGLVAGVAHEVSTPIGVAVTAASHLAERAGEFDAAAGGQLRRSVLEGFLRTTTDSAELILDNLRRAADLVASFKQVAVDSSTEADRTIDLGAYVHDVVASLRPRLRGTPHTVHIDCPPGLELTTCPGALAQVLTNLLLNSLTHGYSDGQAGTLNIEATAESATVRIRYSDDGHGIPAEALPRVFDPFFTTNRAGGGSGLGLHIVHNLVTQRLGGSIRVSSTLGAGTVFAITVPRTEPAAGGARS